MVPTEIYANFYFNLNAFYYLQLKVGPFKEFIMQIYDFYGYSINKRNLERQLSLFGTIFKGSVDVKLIVKRLCKLKQPEKALFSEVVVLLKLL